MIYLKYHRISIEMCNNYLLVCFRSVGQHRQHRLDATGPKYPRQHVPRGLDQALCIHTRVGANGRSIAVFSASRR